MGLKAFLTDTLASVRGLLAGVYRNDLLGALKIAAGLVSFSCSAYNVHVF